MKVRAKFYVTKVSEMGSSGKRVEIHRAEGDTYVSTGVPVREITLSAQYDDGLSKENASFAKATPTGTITFQLDNPELAEAFKPGQVYYVDFTPAA